MNKLDKIIDILAEDMDAKTILKIAINKMTNPARRQMIGELLNIVYGSTYNNGNRLFMDKKECEE